MAKYLRVGELVASEFAKRNNLDRLGKTFNKAEVDLALELEAYENQSERVEKIYSLKMGGRQEVLPRIKGIEGGRGTETEFVVKLPGTEKGSRKRA